MHDRSHLVEQELDALGWVPRPFRVRFLAAGEYNENYLVETDVSPLVFRINHGTQLGLANQIEYEYTVLRAAAPSGVTPRPFRVCAQSETFPKGCLLMEFLPGVPLDYRRDSKGAAGVFARVHRLPASAESKTLVRQDNPVRDILAECSGILDRALDHDARARASIERYRDSVVAPLAGHSFAPDEPCLVNTEVNSGNFVVQDGSVRLVDWEKAVWSFRYQDLGHFLVPTTTLWKSDYVFSAEERRAFLEHYREEADLDLSIQEIDAHTHVLEKTILLRALSWVYMAVGEYEHSDRPIKNESTYRTMKRYLEEIDAFLAVP